VVQDIDELMDSLNHFNPFHRMGWPLGFEKLHGVQYRKILTTGQVGPIEKGWWEAWGWPDLVSRKLVHQWHPGIFGDTLNPAT
jgi:hypothetical protein